MSRQHTTTFVSVPGSDELELELGHVTDQHESDMFFHVTEDHIIVAYLVHDDDCSSPEENDGQGKIYSRSRHAPKDHKDGFCKAIGLDYDGNPNYELVDDDAVLKLVHEDVERWATQDVGKFVDLMEAIADATDEAKPDTDQLAWVRERLDSLDCVGDYSDHFDLDAYSTAAWGQAKLEGKIGNKYAVMLDVYEHGGIAYSVAGEGQQCAFDTARGGAVWVPDENCVENFEDKNLSYEENFKKAREYARGCVEEYTLWANGECYGHVVEKHDLKKGGSEELTACWGFIGQEYAKKECEEVFNHYVEEEKKNEAEG